jgi:lysophospholipase L1-like esterase
MRLLALATIATTLVTTLAARGDSPTPDCATPLDRELAAGQAEAARRQADWGQLLRYRDGADHAADPAAVSAGRGELKPAVVHILAGTNDFAGNTGPTTVEAIEDNRMSMAEIARANRIRVVLASVPPALDFPWRPGLEPSPRIVALNAWARAYARRRKLIYVDYYNALAESHDGIKSTLSDDGVHPNKAGYAVMTPLARQAISRALR